MRRSLRSRLLASTLPWLLLCLPLGAQQEKHGRGYKPPPPTATVVISVVKSNGKPLPNAAVIFRAIREDSDAGNLEMKTDPDGHASIDLLEVGSHVTVQVIAEGYATYASDFDLTPDGKQLLVKLQRPRAQISMYEDDSNQAAQVQPGVQEHKTGVPTTALPSPASPLAPMGTIPPANTPATAPTSTPHASSPGSPQ